MKSFAEFMSAYSDDELKTFIIQYEELELVGHIGECFLRTSAESWTRNIETADTAIVFWMHTIANYAYKKFAHAYLDELRNGQKN